MKNFVGSDIQHGYYDEEGMNAKGKLSFPSSSSSSLRHFPLGWLVNNQEESSTTPQLEFMMDDSSRNNSMTTGGGDDDDDPAPAPASAIDVAVADDGNDDQTEGHVHMVRPVVDASDPLGGGGSASSVGGSNSMVIEREHMFEKVVTPSDVGKLNRLVIPKQHAERYFPLDSSTNEKGLLLNFEDRNGKAWRFRYSYWNSSQSYVITKGWSRFVKEKKLDAGDIVSFQRGVGELFTDRLYIDWRRRPDAPELATLLPTIPVPHHFPYHRSLHQCNPLFLQPQGTVSSFPGPPRDQALMLHANSTVVQSHPNKFHSTTSPYCYNSVLNPCSGSVIYFRSTAGAAQQQHVGMVQMQRRGGGSGVVDPLVLDSVPVVHGKAAAKRLRLFGVNMDCAIPESDECDLLSSSSTMALQQPPQFSSSSSSIQLRPYNGSPLQALPSDFPNKVKSSTMSLDLDI